MKNIGIFILGLLWGLIPAWNCMNSVGGGHGTYILIAISYGIVSLLALLAPLLYVGYAFCFGIALNGASEYFCLIFAVFV